MLSLLPFSALCANLGTASSPDNSSQHYFTVFAALMSPPPPSLQFPFPLGFASWFFILLLLKSYFKPFLSFQLLDLFFLLLSRGSFLLFVCPPGSQVSSHWCPAAGCRMVSGLVVERGELGHGSTAVGLCFRMSLEAALAGWGADCLLVVEGKGAKMELKEGTWKAQHVPYL